MFVKATVLISFLIIQTSRLSLKALVKQKKRFVLVLDIVSLVNTMFKEKLI